MKKNSRSNFLKLFTMILQKEQTKWFRSSTISDEHFIVHEQKKICKFLIIFETWKLRKDGSSIFRGKDFFRKRIAKTVSSYSRHQDHSHFWHLAKLFCLMELLNHARTHSSNYMSFLERMKGKYHWLFQFPAENLPSSTAKCTTLLSEKNQEVGVPIRIVKVITDNYEMGNILALETNFFERNHFNCYFQYTHAIHLKIRNWNSQKRTKKSIAQYAFSKTYVSCICSPWANFELLTKFCSSLTINIFAALVSSYCYFTFQGLG